jgi:hypothetical protein
VVADGQTKERSTALALVRSASESERAALRAWATDLLEIRNSELSTSEKARRALQISAQLKVIRPLLNTAWAEVKRHGWEERNTPARWGLVGAGAGILFGGGAGIAALGGAIGLPLWIVLGAGATFAAVLVEELRGASPHPQEQKRGSPPSRTK